MDPLRRSLLAGLAGLSLGLVHAQPGAGALAASAPGGGPGRGAARWGAGTTPGWSLMTPQEREEHRARMRAMHSHADCEAYRDRHHAQMAARAAERGLKPLPPPRHDACAALKR